MLSNIFCILSVITLLQINTIEGCFRRAPPTSLASDAFSPVDLMFLANFESKAYGFLFDLVETGRLQDEAKLIQSFLTDYEQSTIEGTMQLVPNTNEWVWASVVASHPFLVFRMIRRLLKELPPILVLLEQYGEIDTLNKIYYARENLRWPTIQDKEEVMERIIRIQTVYDVDVSKYADGLYDNGPGIKLSSVYCVEIGRHALAIGKYASAVEWLNIAFRKVFTGGDTTMNFNDIVVELTLAINEHDRMLEHNRLRRPSDLNKLWDKDLFQMPVGQLNSFSGLRLRHLPQSPNDNLFRALELCKGDDIQAESVKKNLRCWYETKKHAYSHISPMKVELLNDEPRLIQVHDFLSSHGVISIIDEAIVALDQLLSSDTSIGPVTTQHLHGTRKRRQVPLVLLDDGRVSSEFNDLSSKLKCVTGHDDDQCTTERLQVSGYTFGSSDLHLEAPDHGIDLSDSFEGELTTMMIFLNDPDQGGYTVFPRIGISVEAKKGSALFWANTFVDVEENVRDTELVYTECPVIMGKKWIAKKKLQASMPF